MMNLRLVRFILFGLFAAAAARAQQVTIDITAGQLNDASGTMLSDGSLVLLLGTQNTSYRVDTDNPNDPGAFGTLLGGSNLAIGSYLNSDVQIIGASTIDSENVAPGSARFSTGSITIGAGSFSSLASGQPVAVAWFPTLTFSATTLPGGASYGLFTTISPLDDSSLWQIPTPGEGGSAVTLNFFTTDIGGSYDPSIANAAYTTGSAVPEPGAYAAIAGVLVVGFVSWRRRKSGRSLLAAPAGRRAGCRAPLNQANAVGRAG